MKYLYRFLQLVGASFVLGQLEHISLYCSLKYSQFVSDVYVLRGSLMVIKHHGWSKYTDPVLKIQLSTVQLYKIQMYLYLQYPTKFRTSLTFLQIFYYIF